MITQTLTIHNYQFIMSTSVNKVCELLKKKDFDEEVVEVFRKNKVSEAVLIELDNDDLKELGIVALGDRKMIKKLINELQVQEPPQHHDLNQMDLSFNVSKHVYLEIIHLSLLTINFDIISIIYSARASIEEYIAGLHCWSCLLQLSFFVI